MCTSIALTSEYAYVMCLVSGRQEIGKWGVGLQYGYDVQGVYKNDQVL
jgi:hypothetical protein